MGKKRFNAKARSCSKRMIDNKETEKIQIDIPGEILEYGGQDEANALVLPSKKRQTKIIKPKQNQITKILSKKQRKLLEKVVDKKKKKEERAELLAALAAVQVPQDELKNYTSISQIQTVGLKNLQKIENDIKVVQKSGAVQSIKISSIAGKCKRKRLALLSGYTDIRNSSDEETCKKARDDNIVGFEQDIDDMSSDTDTEKQSENNFTETVGVNHIKPNNQKEELQENILINNNTMEEVQSKIKQNDLNTKSISTIDENASKPAVYIHVDREPSVQIARLKLPILAEEQQIMETIRENTVVIIAGETGSGKTTQIPQFLYEAGYAEKKLIGITEPRRVAAISMSKRVGKEMNLSDKIVSYLIRFEGNVTDNTKIKFMTDGVLLKEIETDFLLKKYSVVILDEAHERTSYTDILIGLLSRIIYVRGKKKDPLKLIIMSATLRVEDFLNNPKLFKIPPPLLKIEARQYPVTIHFQKRTAEDYVKEAFKKVIKIHSKLPDGGILVFLTGQLEVKVLCRKLKKAFPLPKNFNNSNNQGIADSAEVDDINFDEFDIKKAIKKVKSCKKKFAAQTSNLPKINLDDYKLPTDDTEADLFEDKENTETTHSDLDDENSEEDDILEKTKEPLWVLPLYSLLSSEKQIRVFDSPPEGCRLCVVSTNVAETSLTIPNIKYVVDSGRQKTRLYEKVTGVSSFNVTFTSKASANQRAGRAGRTGPGHCYRLYSSAVFNDEFEDFAMPDIKRKPVDDLMLQMKCIGIDKVINFPFPSPPDIIQLEAAEKRLTLLGALEDAETDSHGKIAKVTALGQAISAFPVAPRYGKMLALSHQKNLLAYVVSLVAGLSIQEIFLEVTQSLDDINVNNSKWQDKRRSWAGSGHSLLLGDAMVLLRAVGASEYAGSLGKMDTFCEQNGLRKKAVIEVRKLRIQLTNEINLNIPNCNLSVDPKMEPPTDLQAKYLRQILLSGMGDQVARKFPTEEISDKNEKRKMKYAYNCSELEEPVFIHSNSVLKKKLPEWVIYQEVYEIQNGDSTKTFMRGVTAIEPEWLLTYVPKACNILNIKEDPAPKYNQLDGKVYCYVEASFGKAGWLLPTSEIEMPLNEKSCRYFGMFLLNGDVFPRLAEYKNKLKITPSSVTKSWSNLNEYVANFIKCLVKNQVNSKSKLENVWKTNKNYLMEQFADLLYGVDLSQISLIWPPLET
ncbi:probable ATP-dependent RNA helicase kurz [Condylostylus longicornis]|uniref:probable ATP-dependent RNA helicase kurz n=1 Tax=Condylostylus longicornis TaxID=2530218 RepID=UPI00244DD643|nr:probable ATP-dependent RNA helicase kurz [Condylostylus longicornis]